MGTRSPDYTYRGRYSIGWIVQCRRLIEADISQRLPERVPTFYCVLALDVMEHIDDDIEAVRQLGRLLKPTGMMLVSVPALPELYSEFDEIQGHRRRYTAQSLRSCLLA